MRGREAIVGEIPRLRRYARALLGAVDGADDLVQDTLERALDKWRFWQSSRDLRPWLFSIMHNLHIDRYRREARVDYCAEQELHAYADDRLEPKRRAAVAAWLAVHPEEHERVEIWRAQSAQLRRAYDDMLDQAIPPRLIPPANTGRWLAPPQRAAIGWLLLGGIAGFFLQAVPSREAGSTTALQSLPHSAAVAHAVYVPEVRHPVEVGVDQEAHLLAWLSKRLGTEIRAPRLDEAGFQLIGGRLLPGDRGEVAQFMYENAEKKRLTLYLQPSAGAGAETAFRHAREGGIDVFYWVDGDLAYALSGNIGRTAIQSLASLVYRQLPRAASAQ